MLAHVFLLVSFALTFALTLDLASTLSTEGNPDKQKSVSELKSPMTVTGKAVVEKNCMFGEILSEGGIEVRILLWLPAKDAANQKVGSYGAKNEIAQSRDHSVKTWRSAASYEWIDSYLQNENIRNKTEDPTPRKYDNSYSV